MSIIDFLQETKPGRLYGRNIFQVRYLSVSARLRECFLFFLEILNLCIFFEVRKTYMWLDSKICSYCIILVR